MANERKVSGAVVLVAWGIVAVSALFALHYGQEWAVNGQMRLCTPYDAIEEPFGHYKPPSNPADLNKPAYWCVRQAQSAEAAKKTDGHSDAYNGLSQFWGDDLISNLFANIGAFLMRWFVQIVNPIFNDQFVPAWNNYFAGGDAQSVSHRTVAIYLAQALFIIIAGVAAKMTFDWLQEILLLRKGEQDKA